jgi:hypothetical protein
MPRADWQFVGNLALLLPPPNEQAAIVRFLDWANGRLERAIRAKRKVIALVNEQKQAIIHHAVTRGLDPNVPLKPSGIPWIGEIPAHWEVLRAKYLYREVDERSDDGSEELLSVSHLTGVTPRSQKNVTMFKASSYAGHKLCRPGDLAVNTMWAWMGALGVSTYTGIISPAYAVYRPRDPERIVGVYMDGLLRSRRAPAPFAGALLPSSWRCSGFLPSVTERPRRFPCNGAVCMRNSVQKACLPRAPMFPFFFLFGALSDRSLHGWRRRRRRLDFSSPHLFLPLFTIQSPEPPRRTCPLLRTSTTVRGMMGI